MIAIGSDHAGFALKQEVVKYLKEKGIEIKEMGCMDGTSCDYPMVAKEVCAEVTSGNAELAILVCGTASFPALRQMLRIPCQFCL